MSQTPPSGSTRRTGPVTFSGPLSRTLISTTGSSKPSTVLSTTSGVGKRICRAPELPVFRPRRCAESVRRVVRGRCRCCTAGLVRERVRFAAVRPPAAAGRNRVTPRPPAGREGSMGSALRNRVTPRAPSSDEGSVGSALPCRPRRSPSPSAEWFGDWPSLHGRAGEGEGAVRGRSSARVGGWRGGGGGERERSTPRRIRVAEGSVRPAQREGTTPRRLDEREGSVLPTRPQPSDDWLVRRGCDSPSFVRGRGRSGGLPELSAPSPPAARRGCGELRSAEPSAPSARRRW